MPVFGRDIIKISHGFYVNPRIRNSNHHIGVPEPKLQNKLNDLVSLWDALAGKVLTGYTKVDGTLSQLDRKSVV